MEVARAIKSSRSLLASQAGSINGIPLSIRGKLDSVLFKVEALSAAVRAVNWSHRDWKAQLGDPGGDRLGTHLTLHNHDVES
jgi:hypothetical protein